MRGINNDKIIFLDLMDRCFEYKNHTKIQHRAELIFLIKTAENVFVAGVHKSFLIKNKNKKTL